EDEAGPLVKESVRDGFSIARAEVARLDRLLTDLVDLHRVGHILVHAKLVDAGRVVSDAVRRVLRDLNAGQVTIELGASDLLDWWDPSVLERIVGSLVLNVARQSEGRPVSVNVDRVGADLRILVHDGEPGMRADGAERAFRRRLGPRKARAGTLDMSLWLVRELAEAHGGGVTSGGRDGAGVVFTVSLGPHRP
ncbi:MAG TPA: HAMP domain-containing sensor histidine kinase, partial [Polyangia bacterium]|nr:HAMP domain-containing sensor histidine kinase [Polyangia bacterium]